MNSVSKQKEVVLNDARKLKLNTTEALLKVH